MITKDSILKAIGEEYRRLIGTSNANEIKQFAGSFNDVATFIAKVLEPLGNAIVSIESYLNYQIKIAEQLLSDPDTHIDADPETIDEMEKNLQFFKNVLSNEQHLKLVVPNFEFLFIFKSNPEDSRVPEDIIKAFFAKTLTMEQLVHQCPSAFLPEDPYEEDPDPQS